MLAEALQNIAKRADPSAVEVAVGRDAEAFTLEVNEYGVRAAAANDDQRRGMGLRLAAFEARQYGGVIDAGPVDEGSWRVRLAVSLAQEPGVTSTRAPENLRLRVLVVDDHDVVHWGFRVLLADQPWVERCLAARTAEEALALTATLKPHVALIDLFLGDDYGADLCRAVRDASPSTRVLLISGAGRMAPAAARATGASDSSPRTPTPARSSRRCARSRSG